jgi:hypothetical protein
VENYRTVSLTCVSCKILEHIICKHMLKHLVCSLFKNSLCGTVSKAFEKSSIAISSWMLLSKLRSKSSVVTKSCVVHEYPALNPWLSLVAITIPTNRSMRVVVEGEHSDNAHVDSGVPQATVLGPLLFLCNKPCQL